MYDSDDTTTGFIFGGIALVILVLIFTAVFVRWQSSTDVVSGIVYNTGNDNFISGSTTFSVRAAVDTYVTAENQSSYCVPAGSQYIPLINKAAADKNVKVVVTAHKYFAIQSPWACNPNITVTEEK